MVAQCEERIWKKTTIRPYSNGEERPTGRPNKRHRDNVHMEQLDVMTNQEECIQGKKNMVRGGRL